MDEQKLFQDVFFQECMRMSKRIKQLEQALADADNTFRDRYKHVFELAHEPLKHDNPENSKFDPPLLNGFNNAAQENKI